MKPFFKNIAKSFLPACAIAMLGAGATSCHAIYDDEGDCNPAYFVKFVFDMNMEYADAFNEQVNSVELWVFDKETKAVADHVMASGQALADDNFLLPISVDPGQYHIVAWCNLEGNRHFKVMDGVTSLTHPSVRMERRHDSERRQTVSDQALDELFHGIIDITAPDALEMQQIVNGGKELEKQTHRYGTQTVYDPLCFWDSNEEKFKVIYTVSLIRNTNNIVLSLEHISGQFDLDNLGIEMIDNNGTMLYDNRLDNNDERITFLPWRTATGSLEQGVQTKAGQAEDRYADFVTTELSTGRMTTDHDKVIRIFEKDSGETMFSLPVNKWISQLRSAKYQNMDEQEYLDRENNFELMVFLQDDGKGGWTAIQIVINGWHIIENGEADL